MAGMRNGPIPSTLSLLSDLHQHPPGTKVRFLGWYVRSCSLLIAFHTLSKANTVLLVLPLRCCWSMENSVCPAFEMEGDMI